MKFPKRHGLECCSIGLVEINDYAFLLFDFGEVGCHETLEHACSEDKEVVILLFLFESEWEFVVICVHVLNLKNKSMPFRCDLLCCIKLDNLH